MKFEGRWEEDDDEDNGASDKTDDDLYLRAGDLGGCRGSSISDGEARGGMGHSLDFGTGFRFHKCL